MDLGWLPEILCLNIGIVIGMFYRDWAIEQYRKEREENEQATRGGNYKDD